MPWVLSDVPLFLGGYRVLRIPSRLATLCRGATVGDAGKSNDVVPVNLNKVTGIKVSEDRYIGAGVCVMTAPLPLPLSVEDVTNHPEYPYVFWDLKPDKKAQITVANGRRGGPFKIEYEVHGHGPVHFLLIMGLGSVKAGWQRQTKDFGHTHADEYSVCILDNRGIGGSDVPFCRYSTSEMALDVSEVLEHLGWTQSRSVHVLGISMGGMIAQELAYLHPEWIASLSLTSTAARLVNTAGFFENLRNRINLFIPRSLEVQVANAKRNIFTEPYLERPDDVEFTKAPFPTNGDRFSAAELRKRRDGNFGRMGFIGQAIAAGWHHKSAAQLKELGDKVGRERIMVLHGSKDRMISYPHGEVLLNDLGGEKAGITAHLIEGQGHVIPIEMRKQFFAWQEELIKKGEALNKAQGIGK